MHNGFVFFLVFMVIWMSLTATFLVGAIMQQREDNAEIARLKANLRSRHRKVHK